MILYFSSVFDLFRTVCSYMVSLCSEGPFCVSVCSHGFWSYLWALLKRAWLQRLTPSLQIFMYIAGFPWVFSPSCWTFPALLVSVLMRDAPVPDSSSWPFAGLCPVCLCLLCTGKPTFQTVSELSSFLCGYPCDVNWGYCCFLLLRMHSHGFHFYLSKKTSAFLILISQLLAYEFSRVSKVWFWERSYHHIFSLLAYSDSTANTLALS